MAKSKIKRILDTLGIDGPWAIILIVFIVLPMIKPLWNSLPGGSGVAKVSANVNEEEQTRDFSHKAVEATINNNRVSVPLRRNAKIEVGDKATKITATSPARQKQTQKVEKGWFYINCDEKGLWDVDVYDDNGLVVQWFQINVY